jgi:hypothetical protein
MRFSRQKAKANIPDCPRLSELSALCPVGRQELDPIGRHGDRGWWRTRELILTSGWGAVGSGAWIETRRVRRRNRSKDGDVSERRLKSVIIPVLSPSSESRSDPKRQSWRTDVLKAIRPADSCGPISLRPLTTPAPLRKPTHCSSSQCRLSHIPPPRVRTWCQVHTCPSRSTTSPTAIPPRMKTKTLQWTSPLRDP